jgi:hypothetical protein
MGMMGGKVNQIQIKYNNRKIYSTSLLYSKESVPTACDPPLLLIFKTAANITIAVNATAPTAIPTVVAIVLAALLSTDMPTTCSLLRSETQ